ncbi:UDP-N-acetylmuramoyl-tripeptide--D-alanyl-D-alanine ligase [bacterium]|nr:UDP-N-acetylmuramoyl-tripeptide--D-alanyl-D-alanine ligase [bacterium]
MLRFDPDNLAQWGKGRWEVRPSQDISGFSIDSRNLGNGHLFVAIKDKRDGHDFIQQAKDSGAVGALVSRWVSEVDLPQLKTSDSLMSFQEIARNHRNKFQGKVVGVTGSCGKTSTKEILKILLGENETLSTRGNLNNHLGVPLTLLQIDPLKHRYAVVEAGINQPEEMKQLAAMIDPDYAIVTLVGNSHLEGLGTLAKVAEEKSKIFTTGKKSPKVIFPESCQNFTPFKEDSLEGKDYLVLRRGEPKSQKIGKHEAFFDFRTETETNGGSSMLRLWRHESPFFSVSLPPLSSGMASNIALSLLAASDMGINDQDLFERLPQYHPSTLRGKTLHGRGSQYFVDCYNANPSSMLDSITFFKESYSSLPKLYVLGGMEELGEKEIELHNEVGKSIAVDSRDLVILLGDKASWMASGILDAGAKEEQVVILPNKEDAISIIEDFQGALFFKGSRSSQLETLVPSWANDIESKQLG